MDVGTPAGPVDVRDKPLLYGVFPDTEDNGNCTCCRHRCTRRLCATHSPHHHYGLANQLLCERRQFIELSVCPAELDFHIAPLRIPKVGEALSEGSDRTVTVVRGPGA